MAYGGGNWVTTNKKLPGAYINFISAARANAELSDRGFVAIPLMLDWGVDGEVFAVTVEEFTYNAKKIFGYDVTHAEMKNLRELFKYAQVVYAYRLNSGTKASNTYGEAKYSGIRGNDIKIVIRKNVDDATKFDVLTYLGTEIVETQSVKTAADLVDNDYVVFKKDATLAESAGLPMTGGANAASVKGEQWSAAFAAFESFSFNVLGIPTADETIKALAAAYVKRLRDELGVKFQVVAHKYEGDYEGIISVENDLKGGVSGDALVYWVAGAEAACAVNATLTNRVYNGEYEIDVDYTQYELGNAIDQGKFMFHRVGTEARVLEDINTLVNLTAEKGEQFQSNQTIRVIDQIGNDIAVLFNTRFLGIVPNDEHGRVQLWSEIVQHHEELQRLRAIENFTGADVTVARGNDAKSVVVGDAVQVINAMSKMYMTCVVA